MKGESILLGVGVGLGLLLLAASSSPAEAPGPSEDWRMKVLRSISKHEGKTYSVQRNLDGAGVSFGIFQWTQAGGGLARLVDALHQREPNLVEQTMGGPEAYSRLIARLRERSLGGVDGAYLWDPPWLQRWKDLGTNPTLAALQWQVALNSEYMQVIPLIAQILGVRSERAAALIANRAVHQGVAGATSTAHRVAAFWEERGAPSSEIARLAAYGWACADNFSSPTSKGEAWKWVEPQVDLTPQGKLITMSAGAYHRFAGPWDLWDLIIRRSAEILQDPQWSDQRVL